MEPRERLYPTPAELLVLKAQKIVASASNGELASDTCIDQLHRLLESPEARAIALRFAGRELAPPLVDETGRMLAERLRPRSRAGDRT